MKILDKYLLKTFLGTFTTVFVILFFVFILQTVWLFIGELAGKDLDFMMVIKFKKKDKRCIIHITCEKVTNLEKDLHLFKSGKNYIKIIFKDNGIGFEKEYSEKIFQIFQRLHGKSEYPGSGIGLAICKKIVENHDGVIFAQAEPDKGATFTVILPENQL